MIIKNGKTISSIYKGNQVIEKIMKGTLVVYESFKTLIASGVPPLKLLNCKGVDLIDYKLYGNSVQEGTPTPEAPIELESVGEKTKNLLEGIEERNFGTNGVNTDNQNRLRNKGYIEVKPNTQYTVSWKSKDTTNPIRLSFSDFAEKDQERTKVRAWYNSPATFTTEATTNYVRLMFNATTEKRLYVDDIYEVQFEENSSATDYEPYGYKIPVKASGKNLFNYIAPAIANGSVIEELENGAIVKGKVGNTTVNFAASNGWFKPGQTDDTGNGILVNGGDTITVSADVTLLEIGSSDLKQAMTMHLYSREKNSGPTSASTTNLELNQTKRVVRTYTISNSYSGNTMYPVFCVNSHKVKIENIQITNNGDTSYETYHEPITTNIYLNEPLRKKDDYIDYIDFKNSNVIRYVNNVELSTSLNRLNFSTNWDNEDYTTFYFLQEDKLNADYPISNYFKKHNTYLANVYENVISTNTGNNYIYVKIAKSIATNTDELNDWLETLENKPYVNYVLSTPTEETIELPNMPTFKGTTILEVDTNIQPSNLEVIYKGKEVK